MPSRAFVPAPLTEAQPRVYRSFRGRQIKGLVMGATGAVLSLSIFGAGDFLGYALAFAAALPGFAYGYYQPHGKPVEYWLKVVYRYYTGPQLITAQKSVGWPLWRRAFAQIKPEPWAVYCAIRRLQRRRKERQTDGR